MFPPAPGRLSTMNGCPHTALKCWPTRRARMSTPPPAVSGTMIRTGRFGYCCALAGAMSAQQRRKAEEGRRKECLMAGCWSSDDRRGALDAGDHAGDEQELALALHRRGLAPQLVEVLLTLRLRLLVEPLQVADGVLLHILEIDRPTLAHIEIEKPGVRLAATHARELL